MIAKRLSDPRLCPSPAVYSHWNGKKIVIVQRMMTPLRMALVSGCFIDPLVEVWRIITAVFLLDQAYYFFYRSSTFHYLPFTREQFLYVMGGLFLLWSFEIVSRFSLSRMLFGKNIKVVITKDKVRIGNWLTGKRIPRSRKISFLHTAINYSKMPVYMNSSIWGVVINDDRNVWAGELFDQARVEKLITNLKVALDLSDILNVREVDPMASSEPKSKSSIWPHVLRFGWKVLTYATDRCRKVCALVGRLRKKGDA